MHTRHITGLVLALLTVLVLVPGLIDPVEGSIPLAIGGLLIIVTWAISRISVPKLEWIAWLTAVLSGAVALVAVFLLRTDEPMGGTAWLPWWIWILIALYEISVVGTIIGAVQYVVRHVRALRHSTSAAVT